MYAAQFLTHTVSRHFLTSGSLGVMGTALPYAIGAKIANRSKTLIVIDGDQSFNMSFTDLKTLLQYNIHIKIIIMNNSSQDMVRCWEDLFFEGRLTATQCTNPDYCKMAESFKLKTILLESGDDMEKKLKDFLSYEGSILLNAIVESDFCFPLVKPGSALDDMVLVDTFDKNNSNMSGEAPS